MYKPERDIASLELAEKLKELGFSQDGEGFYWRELAKDFWVITYISLPKELEILKDFNIIRTPTIAEVLEWLPEDIEDGRPFFLEKNYDQYRCGYETVVVKEDFYPANALTKLLLWAYEHGYVKFEEK